MSYIAPKQHWNWRCSKEKCKARYCGPTHPDDYKRGWKCKACGGTQFRIIKDMRKETGRIDCTCNGFMQWAGPHRRGSRGCWYNADGTTRLHIRTQAERLHPHAMRTAADVDQHGKIWWFYDGELESEAAWTRTDDPSQSEWCWNQGMLELQSASAQRGQLCTAGVLARNVDGSPDSCNAAVD